ncbi:MAG: 50S ribosomal protein L24 [Candidatus Calescibacterium sp.]|jgi:large subunit ribosomal protein L24|nr:50S ribosomal protein L24 [Candidatus Calescibacterium sp.]
MRKLKTGDTVFVIAGKDKGKIGRILRVFPKEDRAIVEGVNRIKKHVKPTPRNPQGGIIEVFGKIHISNLMLVCPKCKKPTRVGIKILEDKRKLRYCKKCGDFVDQI